MTLYSVGPAKKGVTKGTHIIAHIAHITCMAGKIHVHMHTRVCYPCCTWLAQYTYTCIHTSSIYAIYGWQIHIHMHTHVCYLCYIWLAKYTYTCIHACAIYAMYALSADRHIEHTQHRQCLGFRVQGLGFRVQGLGFRVQGLGLQIAIYALSADRHIQHRWHKQGIGFRVQGLGFRCIQRIINRV